VIEILVSFIGLPLEEEHQVSSMSWG